MIDINTLTFEEVTNTPETYWAANLEEVDGIVQFQAIYTIDFNTDALKVSLAVGNPQTGDWADSSNTNDWPKLDAMFGRSAWQAWLADKQEEVLVEYAPED